MKARWMIGLLLVAATCIAGCGPGPHISQGFQTRMQTEVQQAYVLAATQSEDNQAELVSELESLYRLWRDIHKANCPVPLACKINMSANLSKLVTEYTALSHADMTEAQKGILTLDQMRQSIEAQARRLDKILMAPYVESEVN